MYIKAIDNEPRGRLTVVQWCLRAVHGRPGARPVHGCLGAEHRGATVGRRLSTAPLCAPSGGNEHGR